MPGLKALHDRARLQRLTVSTYQAVSGMGRRGNEELLTQTGELMANELGRLVYDGTVASGLEPVVFARPIAFNVLPSAGSLLSDGSAETTEERKLRDETRKSLDLPRLPVSAACVRVLVFTGHSMVINAEFAEPISPGEAEQILARAAGVEVVDIPTPQRAAGTDITNAGRVRRDEGVPDGRGLSYVVSGDNLRKGAALNEVQLAELVPSTAAVRAWSTSTATLRDDERVTTHRRSGTSSPPHEVVFLLSDQVKLLDVSGPAEVFAEANRHGGNYRLCYTSPGGDAVATSIGIAVDVDADTFTIGHADTVIVPGGDHLVSWPIDPSLTDAARHLATISDRVASVCTGAFVLARTGLLDGRRATTHWRHAAALAKFFPAIDVQPDAIYVADGTVFTSAGVSAGMDLALALVESDHGAQVARAVARDLVLYLQRPGGQSQYSAPLRVPVPQQSALRVAVDAVVSDPSADHTVDSLAAIAGVTARHLRRQFASEIGLSPSRFVERMRLERARELLDDGYNVTEAARLSGFRSAENFRRTFTKEYGIPPSRHQRQFGIGRRDDGPAN
ncbi:Asd/ArgC dimerization domain-containing protein [Streptomyces rubrogriseus]|uniref:Asd/ArgC dimerization domain-containing protein n=1 Tax=Streptomyces rubrogriseus TaxID=194673 RepID=UPI0036FB399F